jgi:hypothetical protein
MAVPVLTEALAFPSLEAPFAPWIFEYVLSALGLVVSVLMIGVPFFYLWDFVVETSSVGLGYWTYFDTFGPSVKFASTAISLVHPLILFTSSP